MLATTRPFTKPTATPRSRATSTHTMTGSPRLASCTAVTPAAAATEPTERSIPPQISTQVMPKAIRQFTQTFLKVLRMFVDTKKESVVTESSIHISASATIAPRFRFTQTKGVCITLPKESVDSLFLLGMIFCSSFYRVRHDNLL